jgi:hypothetical protein
MINKEISVIKTMSEIMEHECKEKRYKEINMELYSNGVHYTANNITMFFRETTNEYIIMLHTFTGFLINTMLDLRRAESEYRFLCAADDTSKEGPPITINSFCYVYDKSREEKSKMVASLSDLIMQ